MTQKVDRRSAQYLRASYLVWCLESLPEDEVRALDELSAEIGQDWRHVMQAELGLPPSAIRTLWHVLTEHQDGQRALDGLMRLVAPG